MKRRDLVMTALTGVAALVALPRRVKAAVAVALTNLLYTQDDPGHWKGKEGSHVPVVEIAEGRIKIRTPHPMSETHYIVSHSVTLAYGTFLDRKTFTWKDEPVSEFTLPAGYRGGIVVASFCNLHDMWIKEVEV